MTLLPRPVAVMTLVPVVLLTLGTAGFHLLEGLPLFDALYLTVVTLTTIGYGDIVPRTMPGRVFTMGLILGGVFTLLYAATALIRVVVSGELAEYLGKQNMERTIAKMKDHV